jgi:hypothetical protein
MAEDLEDDDFIVGRMRAGDPHALGELFDRHRPRLRKMVKLQMDRRLQDRLGRSRSARESYRLARVDLAGVSLSPPAADEFARRWAEVVAIPGRSPGPPAE